MRAWENVAYPLKVRGVALQERRTRALDSLGRVGMGNRVENGPQELSGGQQQRVALARALVFAPKGLLLDEPLSALDANLRVEMRDEILRVQRAAGIATLLVTHDQEEALSIADRVTAPLLSLVVGVPVAMTLARLSAKMRTSLLIAISLPLTFSGLIVAYGFILQLGRAGFVTLLLAKVGFDPAIVGGFNFSPLGRGFAYAYYLVPRVVLIVLPAIRNFDAVQLRAALSLGAGPWRVLFDVLLPQSMPSLVGAFCH